MLSEELAKSRRLQLAMVGVVVVSVVAYLQPPQVVFFGGLAVVAGMAWLLPTSANAALYLLLLGVQLPGTVLLARWAIADLFLLVPIVRVLGSASLSRKWPARTSLIAPMLAVVFVMAAGTVVGVFATGHLSTYVLFNKDVGLAFLVLGAFVFVDQVRTIEDVRRVVDLFVIGASLVNVVCIGAAIVAAAGYPNFVYMSSGRMNGLLLNPTSYGSLLLMVVMLELPRLADSQGHAFAPAILRWINCALLLASLSMTLSRSTWLSLAAGAGALIAMWFISGNARRIPPSLWAGAVTTLIVPVAVLVWIASAHGSILRMLPSSSESRANALHQQVIAGCATKWDNDLCSDLDPELIIEERAKLAQSTSTSVGTDSQQSEAPQRSEAPSAAVNPDGALMNARGLEDRAAIIRAALHDYSSTWLTTVTGIGLGTFLATSAQTFGVPLIVHNTVIWFLTEMGPLGLAALGWFLGRTAFNLWETRKLGSWPGELSHGLTAAMAAWFVLSMFNEAFYFRHFWLVVILADRLYVLSRSESVHRQVASEA